ncbi:MAG: ornithine cyclodeaminase [Bacteroides sp. SM23_62]|nr:MAG: ornithine cyclodeaminase [Bacteroides sp. SM23_62]
MEIITLDQIKQVLPYIDILPQIEEGFREYSKGKVTVPPVGEMILDKGEVHIKYGFVKGEEYYVIKIASGFYGNPDLGLPSGNGLMLLFKQKTGELVSILLDEGYLTDIRTAVAGAIAAKYLAPSKVHKIGIAGTGTQGRLQLLYLKEVVNCREILVWGRKQEKLDAYKSDMEKEGFHVETTLDSSEILKQCNLVVTSTPSKTPVLSRKDLKQGIHITAVGSDTPEKQEVDSLILRDADIVVADSIEQCMVRGEIYKAIEAGVLKKEELLELGNVIAGPARGRTSDQQITIADLTGVAVQDISIATAVHKAVNE